EDPEATRPLESDESIFPALGPRQERAQNTWIGEVEFERDGDVSRRLGVVHARAPKKPIVLSLGVSSLSVSAAATITQFGAFPLDAFVVMKNHTPSCGWGTGVAPGVEFKRPPVAAFLAPGHFLVASQF